MAATQKILIVEDDPEIRASLIDALEDEGHQVVAACDGLDALERLREPQAALPKLILLDLTMPRLDGMQFGAELSKVNDWSAIPVVVLSADDQIRAKAQALGAIGYLRKPVKLRELFSTISKVLHPPAP
jgi:two-component system chemotaxis response regulator CheY